MPNPQMTIDQSKKIIRRRGLDVPINLEKNLRRDEVRGALTGKNGLAVVAIS